jgi:mRNA-degrading endonuclease RelE of RelBE toxin-antitoxin system
MMVIGEDPFRLRPGADIRPLWAHDEPPLYRLRVSDYRVLYFVVANEVRVTEVAHRSQAYRSLD